ncbi:MAG TPA: SDR family oxidoreductase [Trebonia sp.]|nr:SDR family oxidoreductase [Trebonia sp.]
MTFPFELTGRVALVTGSSRGIGSAIADALARSGAAVILNGRDESRLARALDSARRRTPGAAWSACAFDVTDEAATERAVAHCESAIGPIDILVNNAGIQLRKPLTEISLANWRSVIDTDLTSAFLVGRTVARPMIQRRRGKIINVCSVQSELARPGIGAYTAAKGGLRNLTRAMAAEWSPEGLQVNGLAPGYILTEMTRPLAEDPEFDAWVRNRTPARRWGRVEDLAGPAVWLASPASDFVTGQVIYVDGGMTSVV